MSHLILRVFAVGVLLAAFSLPCAVMAAEEPVAAEPAAPSAKTETLGLLLNLGYYQVRDHTLQNPHRHQGLLIGGSLDYERQSGQLRHGLSLGFGYASLSDAYGLSAYSVLTGLRYEVQRNVRKIGAEGNWSLYAGGFLSYKADVAIYPFTDEAHFYWLSSISAGPAVTFESNVWDGALARIGLRAPLAAYVSRPPLERFYNNDKDKMTYILSKTNEDMRFRTIDEHLAIDGEASLRFKLAGRMVETLGYRLSYTRDTAPVMTQILSHSVFIRISAQW